MKYTLPLCILFILFSQQVIASLPIKHAVNAGTNTFFISDGKLWVTNGSSGGTKQAYSDDFANKPLFDTTISRTSDLMVGFNEKVIFKASSPASGEELWISNGTQAGTYLLKDILPGQANSNIRNFIPLGNKVAFIAYSSDWYEELWITDGTNNGTLQLTPSTGWNQFEPKEWRIFNNKLYFSKGLGWDNTLWVTDGTPNGTFALGSFINPKELHSDGTKVFFNHKTFMGDSYIAVTDGTPAGTLSLSLFTHPTPVRGQVINGKYYFRHPASIYYHPYSTYFDEMFVSDGTELGTKPFTDPSESQRYYSFQNPYKHQNILFFTAQYGWSSDLKKIVGNTIEPVQTNLPLYWVYQPIRWDESGPLALSIANNFFFEGNFYNPGSTELWVSNGENAGTLKVKDFSGTSPNLILKQEHVFGNKFYFTFKQDNLPDQHWVSDGTELGTLEISSINSSLNLSELNYLCVSNNAVYFSAKKSGNFHLFKTDGNSITQLTGNTCPNNLNINTAINTTSAYSSSNSITATSKINGSAKVDFESKAIEMLPGFEAVSGSTFLAQVGGCQ